MNNQPLFIIYGGQLLNVRDIKRAFLPSPPLLVNPEYVPPGPTITIEFRSGGFATLVGEDVSLDGLAKTIAKLDQL